MNIIDSLKWRYATKKFDDNKLIDSNKIETIKEAFNLTATSYGLQPVKLVIIKDKALQKRLVEISMGQHQVAQASHVLVFCIDTKINSEYIDQYFNRVKTIRNTPEEILKPFQDYITNSFDEKEYLEIENWATKQAYITMGNLLTVCAIEKIDACPMEGFSPKAYDEILALNKKNLKSVLVMPIGYRAEDDMFADFKKVRKTLDESVIIL